MTIESREHVRRYFDGLGDAEWHRLAGDVRGRVSLEVHRRLLAGLVRPGDRVLEVGAGPGRFTFELAALGATVVVTDLSPVQLALNEERLRGSEAEASVERWEVLDVCDTGRYADGEFDLVLAFGGPLSYAFEQAGDALRGLFRVTRPGGLVAGSVMSLLGTWRTFLPGVVKLAERAGEDANDLVLRTGDLRHMGVEGGHVCRMFRSADLAALIRGAGGEVVALSASNWASLGDPDVLAALEADPGRWARFLEHEVAACREPGAVDGGTHILFAARHL
ncbi:class I SAM-dependent methyltransferase [Nonomuraea sp. PA05]|uniref:class I SAM-dependent methyltransferase n=1 Tax=Nonomuraea sp. PA05 TaxID=2604466 RepID=UPI0011DBACE6|nr:class I SAM-dependent methyltransferase [Nonomuraea sp. PA05]TYB58034.1 class I SAM-dependent methyltransferase [Nonomuraea sp. PA05]